MHISAMVIEVAVSFIGIVLTAGVGILGYLAHSVNQLNKKLGIVIERQAWQGKAIDENTEDIKVIKNQLHGGRDCWNR